MRNKYSPYIADPNEVCVEENTVLYVDGVEVNVYIPAAVKEAGLYISSTHPSTIPNRSAIRVLRPLLGRVLKIKTRCLLVNSVSEYTVRGLTEEEEEARVAAAVAEKTRHLRV